MGMHTRWGSPGASKKLNLNKVLRNTIGPALVLAAWDQVAQAQSTNDKTRASFFLSSRSGAARRGTSQLQSALPD